MSPLHAFWLSRNQNPLPNLTIGAASNISDAGLQFVARHEGMRLKLYNDPAGHATIGVGHLVHKGPINGTEPEEFRKGITEQRALELLREDSAKAVQAVSSLVKVTLSQAQFDALSSFVFNVGRGAFASSDLLKKLNSGNYGAVPNELNRFVRGGGKKLPGLVARRQDEGKLFSQGTYI
jgi:lysozyme